MTRLHSYPSIYALGHAGIADLFAGPVVVQEKVDGSQFSFGVDAEGNVSMRSKGVEVFAENAQMFDRAAETVAELAPLLTPGLVYRGEYLRKPKHNSLAYDRIPAKFIVLYDIEQGDGQHYLDADAVAAEAQRLGLEVVPTLLVGVVENVEAVHAFLGRESFLGGQLIEGVVVKNYALFTVDKKVAMGKFVSERFKEVHSKEWRKSNPTRGDIIDDLIQTYRKTARWEKAVQHLQERGEYDGSPRDIGNLLKEVGQDVLKEERDAIADALFKYAWPKIQRGITAGLPDWYKERLLGQAFDNDGEAVA